MFFHVGASPRVLEDTLCIDYEYYQAVEGIYFTENCDERD